MVNAITNREHFQFMFFCVKHATNGKVNFEKVAVSMNIASKSAAQKRWERLMRSHGLDPKTGVYIFTGTKDDSEPEDSNDELALTTPTTTPLKRKASTKSVTFEEAPAAKKRKRASALARAEALVAKMEDGDLKYEAEDEKEYRTEA